MDCGIGSLRGSAIDHLRFFWRSAGVSRRYLRGPHKYLSIVDHNRVAFGADSRHNAFLFDSAWGAIPKRNARSANLRPSSTTESMVLRSAVLCVRWAPFTTMGCGIVRPAMPGAGLAPAMTCRQPPIRAECPRHISSPLPAEQLLGTPGSRSSSNDGSRSPFDQLNGAAPLDGRLSWPNPRPVQPLVRSIFSDFAPM